MSECYACGRGRGWKWYGPLIAYQIQGKQEEVFHEECFTYYNWLHGFNRLLSLPLCSTSQDAKED